VRSLGADYAWLSARRPQCLCVETSSKPRTSTDAPRSSRNESAWTWNVREACVFGRAPSVIYASGVCRMFVEYCSYASTCAIFQWFVSDCELYVHGSCVIHAWFVSDFYPDTPKIWSISGGTSTHKPNLSVIC